jgi:hypothetical protein
MLVSKVVKTGVRVFTSRELGGEALRRADQPAGRELRVLGERPFGDRFEQHLLLLRSHRGSRANRVLKIRW